MSGFSQARQACECVPRTVCSHRRLQAQDEGDIDELDWAGRWYPMEELRFTVDSGAVDTVAPPGIGEAFKLQENQASKEG
eukprot:15483529-Alexandrium_andersonii.AAC.1